MKEKSNNWEKLKALSAIIASVFVPVAVVLIGNFYSTAIKNSETRARYIELAVDILKEEPSENKTNIRKWAINLINYYSEVDLDDQTKNELLQDPLLEQVSVYMEEEWIPYFVEEFLNDSLITEAIRTVINSGIESEEETKKFIKFIVTKLFKKIDERKQKLIKEIQEGHSLPLKK
jgi:hypothetical protein